MAGHRTHHNPLEQDTLFTTPASFMLDARLTPLERNGWQVPRSSERPCAQRAVSGSRKRPQLPTGLPALLQSSIGHENNLVDRVAVHIQAKQVQAPEAASIATHGQRRDDDDLPLHRRIRPDPCSSHDPG
ncbi:hypothetical protein [Sutterella wadsworthensis]|uniref:hypothetical protein n=1 Tax=Sutterella wadsworthensis TaxID=40545 RepID=UPI003AF06FD9